MKLYIEARRKDDTGGWIQIQGPMETVAEAKAALHAAQTTGTEGDYRMTGQDLYADAAQFGKDRGNGDNPAFGPLYWTAWYAARRTAGALLDEAQKLGLTAKQIEGLRVVARQVAYD